MKKQLCLLTTCVSMAMAGCSSQSETPTTEAAASTAETTAAETTGAGAATGTFTGKGNGYGGEVQVDVTFENGEIKDFEIISGNETSLLQKRAMPVLKERVLEAQTPVVDSVSGATFTSYAVKTAIADAGKQAGLDFGEITMTTQGPVEEPVELEAVTTH